MSLIPFILDLADELHEFNRCLAAGGMDVDDFGFGIYPHELQQQPPQHQPHLLQPPSPLQTRRPRALSQLYWLPSIGKGRHHPYYRNKVCCNKATSHLVPDPDKESHTPNAANAGSGSGIMASGEKDTSSPNAAGKSAYSVVNKNGFQVSMNVKQFAPNELTVKTIDNCIVVEGQHEDKEDGHGVISRHFIRKYMLPKGYDPNEVLSTLSSDGILTVKAPPPATKTDESMERIVDIQQTGPTQQSVKDSSSKEQTKNTAAAVTVATTAATTTAAAAAAASVAAATATNATAAVLQQQQQQELPKSHERNGDANPNEISTEQETEPAEPTTSSSSIASSSSNSNVNSNTNSNRNEEPATLLLASNVATPAAIDAIMAASVSASAATANDEDNEDANMDVDLNVNVNLEGESTAVKQTENDALAAVAIATATNNNTNNNSTTNTNANNSCGNTNSNNTTTDNGITDTTPATTIESTPPANNLPIAADVTVVGIETVPVPMTVIDGVAVAENDADGMDGVVTDGIGTRVEVSEVVADASITGNADSETVVAVENLVVVSQPPTTADLVAAADAAILLGKTQCENGNENGQKTVITEEITN